MDNYYHILGVSESATNKEIQSVFRKLAKATHPDLNKNNPAKIAAFTQIKQAYDTLSKPEKRKKYDAALHPPKRKPQTQSPSYTHQPRTTSHRRNSLYLLFRYHLFSTCTIIGLYIILNQVIHFNFPKLLTLILIYKGIWLITLLTFFSYRRHRFQKRH